MNFNYLLSFKILLFLSLSVTLYAQELEQAVPEEVGVSTDRINRLTEVLQNYTDQGKMSGAVSLIA